MTPRLATSVRISALIRIAEAQGGFAAVLAKGDPTAGSILLLLAERGGIRRIFERLLQPDGSYSWQPTGPQAIDNTQEIDGIIARRRQNDPDLWILELDIPSLERFAAEMNAAN